MNNHPLSASQRLHNICDALSEQMDGSAFTREEWERVDKQTVALQAEVSTLREHLAEVNRLMSLNVAEVARLQGLMGSVLLLARSAISADSHIARRQRLQEIVGIAENNI